MSYIFFGLLGAFLLSIADTLCKYALNNSVSNVNFIFWSHGVTYAVCLVILLLICRYIPLKFLTNTKPISFYDIIKFNNNKKVNMAIILSGVIAFMALISIIYAFKISDNIGYTVALLSTSCLFTLIFSYIYLKSNIELKGIFGCILIIVGVILISNCSNKSRF